MLITSTTTPEEPAWDSPGVFPFLFESTSAQEVANIVRRALGSPDPDIYSDLTNGNKMCGWVRTRPSRCVATYWYIRKYAHGMRYRVGIRKYDTLDQFSQVEPWAVFHMHEGTRREMVRPCTYRDSIPRAHTTRGKFTKVKGQFVDHGSGLDPLYNMFRGKVIPEDDFHEYYALVCSLIASCNRYQDADEVAHGTADVLYDFLKSADRDRVWYDHNTHAVEERLLEVLVRYMQSEITMMA